MNEEILLLEEQLASAQADIERLQTRLAEAESLVASRDETIGALRGELDASRDEIAGRDDSIATQAAEVEALRSAVADADERDREAARRYRELALAREPDLPGDLVGGESIAEVDAALAQARETVSQVRQRLEAQAQALRVPPGAPARGAPDAGDLSPAEKIRLGLQQT